MAETQRKARKVLIRDGSHSQAWIPILKAKANGKHDRAITRSVKAAQKGATIIETLLEEAEAQMERELEALPPALRRRVQAKLQKIQSVEPELSASQTDVEAGEHCRDETT